MIQISVYCGCGVLIARHTKDDGQEELTEREFAGECEEHSGVKGDVKAGEYFPANVLPPIPPRGTVETTASVLVSNISKEPQGQGKRKPKSPKEKFKEADRRERLKRRQQTLKQFKAVLIEEGVLRDEHGEERVRKGKPRFYVVSTTNCDEDGQPEVVITVPGRRNMKEPQVRARAGTRR